MPLSPEERANLQAQLDADNAAQQAGEAEAQANAAEAIADAAPDPEPDPEPIEEVAGEVAEAVAGAVVDAAPAEPTVPDQVAIINAQAAARIQEIQASAEADIARMAAAGQVEREVIEEINDPTADEPRGESPTDPTADEPPAPVGRGARVRSWYFGNSK